MRYSIFQLMILSAFLFAAANTVAEEKPLSQGGKQKTTAKVEKEESLQSKMATQLANFEPVQELVKTRGILVVACALVVCWVLLAFSLQLACWFSLVETSFKQCGLLALITTIPILVATAVSVFLFSSQSPNAAIGFLGIWAISILICVFWAKRILECKWRSVVTILVMFKLSFSLILLSTCTLTLFILVIISRF